MLSILVCEDDSDIRKLLVEKIKRHIIIKNYDMEVVCETGDPELLLHKSKKQPAGSVYFFDIDLKHNEYDGFKLAKKVHAFDPNSVIIFITSHSDLVFESFKYHVSAMDFIVKDTPEKMGNRIGECLDSIQDRLKTQEQEDDAYFVVKVLEKVYNVPIDEIYYFETSRQKHRVIMYAENEVLEFFETMVNLEERFGESFIRTHRSFLVNKNKIASVDLKKNVVELVNGATCLLSRSAKRYFREAMPE